MYYYVSGTVAHVEPYLAVIDCGGVGYACRTTAYTLSQIKKGDKVKLFTYLSVRRTPWTSTALPGGRSSSSSSS